MSMIALDRELINSHNTFVEITGTIGQLDLGPLKS